MGFWGHYSLGCEWFGVWGLSCTFIFFTRVMGVMACASKTLELCEEDTLFCKDAILKGCVVSDAETFSAHAFWVVGLKPCKAIRYDPDTAKKL